MTAGRKTNSQNKHWCTPHKYVEAVTRVFDIALDPCSNEYSIVPAKTKYILPDKNGLIESWNFPTIYVNPPYGKDVESGTSIKHWLVRCARAFTEHNSEVIALIPVATNTSHWKDCIWNVATGISFLYDTRLRFLINGENVGKGAPMACAMIYWGRNLQQFHDVFKEFGAVIRI